MVSADIQTTFPYRETCIGSALAVGHKLNMKPTNVHWIVPSRYLSTRPLITVSSCVPDAVRTPVPLKWSLGYLGSVLTGGGAMVVGVSSGPTSCISTRMDRRTSTILGPEKNTGLQGPLVRDHCIARPRAKQSARERNPDAIERQRGTYVEL